MVKLNNFSLRFIVIDGSTFTVKLKLTFQLNTYYKWVGVRLARSVTFARVVIIIVYQKIQMWTDHMEKDRTWMEIWKYHVWELIRCKLNHVGNNLKAIEIRNDTDSIPFLWKKNYNFLLLCYCYLQFLVCKYQTNDQIILNGATNDNRERQS